MAEMFATVIDEFLAHFAVDLFQRFQAVGSKAGIDHGQPRLFMVEPSGRFFEYYACAAGKGSQVCKGELDKLDLSNLSTEEGAYRLTKMLIKSREEGQDKRLDIEVGWLNGSTEGRFEPLPEDTRKRYEADATEELEKEEMGEA